MTTRLEQYALIGDGESTALVSKDGSIDWLCWPRFDSDACFAALLGDDDNGRWRIAPQETKAAATWRYRDDTLIVENEFSSGGGRAMLVDLMPMRDGAPSLVRRLVGLEGELRFRSVLSLRFGYGSVPPWIELDGQHLVGRVGPDLIVLYADVPLERAGYDAVAEFTLREGDTVDFVMRIGDSTEPPPPPLPVDQAIADTEAFWRGWIGRFDRPTDWPDAVRRSLITLKALINQPTGGIVAAPTCSLPEVPGGTMNWDYRFCWLRDSAFSLAALINAGFTGEAKAWRDWILRTIAGSPEHIQIMYRVDGGRDLAEWSADWLEGYDWSTPVRVGNAAARQRQVDIYGELLDVFYLADRAGLDSLPHALKVEHAIVDHLQTCWHKPGHGIWEARGEPRHYVYSKVMAWVAVDRFLRQAQSAGLLDAEEEQHLHRLRDTIHRSVCDEGYHPGMKSFVQYYGGEEIDASLLLIPSVGFLPADDPRMIGTVARVESELIEDGLLYRNSEARRKGQAAFLACNCWLADCYMKQGREADARATFEKLLSVRSELGLLSEEYTIRGGRLCGNFPQALSHLALVTTGIGLCGPVLQRGGG